jgi:hypothetical protein
MNENILYIGKREIRKYRCSKGHTWTNEQDDFSMTLMINNQMYCMYCLIEFANKNLGTVISEENKK